MTKSEFFGVRFFRCTQACTQVEDPAGPFELAVDRSDGARPGGLLFLVPEFFIVAAAGRFVRLAFFSGKRDFDDRFDLDRHGELLRFKTANIVERDFGDEPVAERLAKQIEVPADVFERFAKTGDLLVPGKFRLAHVFLLVIIEHLAEQLRPRRFFFGGRGLALDLVADIPPLDDSVVV